MTTADDGQWRRPSHGVPQAPAAEDARPAAPEYAGPPPTVAPPPGWRPPVVVEPPKPRTLPEQDHELVDAREQSSRTLTIGVTMLAGAIMLVILLLLCGRALF